MDPTVQTPAGRLVARFGAERLAGWTGRHRSRIHAWTWPTSKGGTGGVIPPRLRPSIVDGAKQDLDVELALTEFEPADGEAYLFDGTQA